MRTFTRPTGKLTWDVYSNILKELQDRLVYLLFYFQGEPFLHKNFFEFVKYASQRNIYTATSTNAHFLTEENARKTVLSGLDRLVISIDGTDQKTYSEYRKNGKLARVIEGTKNLVAQKKLQGKKTPYIIFQFIVFKSNEHQVPEIKKLGRSLGVDKVAIKTAQIYDYQNSGDIIPENPKYARYKKGEDGQFHIKNQLLNHCWKMWHSCVITWDGKVVPCCFDKDAAHQLGDITKEKFRDLWHGKSYAHFRSKLFKSRKNIDICRNCTEGTKVWG